MKPASPAILAAHKPPEANSAPTAPPDNPKSGAAAQTTTAPPPNKPESIDKTMMLDLSVGTGCDYAEFIFRVESAVVRRLLTRTGRATREQMLAELPRYVERIVKRALENEVF